MQQLNRGRSLAGAICVTSFVTLGLYACGADGNAEPDTELGTAAEWLVSDADDSPSEANAAGSQDGLVEKGPCTSIQFCDAPASFSERGVNWGTVCRVRTSCDKFDPAIPGQCDSDLRAIGCSRHQPAIIAYDGEVL